MLKLVRDKNKGRYRGEEGKDTCDHGSSTCDHGSSRRSLEGEKLKHKNRLRVELASTSDDQK